MKIKQTILVIVTLIGLSALAISPSAYAIADEGSNSNSVTDGSLSSPDDTSAVTNNVTNDNNSNSCAGVTTNIIDCTSTDGDGIENSGLWNLLLTVINILSAGIGIAAVGGVVYGAVLYSSAGANPDNVKKAKEMFVNIGIGIVAYILMYSLLNYLIPGGLFN